MEWSLATPGRFLAKARARENVLRLGQDGHVHAIEARSLDAQGQRILIVGGQGRGKQDGILPTGVIIIQQLPRVVEKPKKGRAPGGPLLKFPPTGHGEFENLGFRAALENFVNPHRKNGVARIRKRFRCQIGDRAANDERRFDDSRLDAVVGGSAARLRVDLAGGNNHTAKNEREAEEDFGSHSAISTMFDWSFPFQTKITFLVSARSSWN